MLIHRNQHTERIRRNLLQQEHIGRAVAVKALVELEFFNRRFVLARSAQFRRRLVGRLAFHQCLRLRQNVGEQNFVMLADFVVRHRRNDKVYRHRLGSLVQKLEERMLHVGSRPAEQRRPRRVIGNFAVVEPHRLAVALHVKLLQIRRQELQILVIRNHRIPVDIVIVVVPNPQQRHNHRNVLLQRRGTEMVVHRLGAAQKLVKILVPDRNRNGKPDSRPQGVTPADEIPELKHIVDVNAEFRHRLGVRRKRDKVVGNRRLAQRFDQPVAAGARVGQRFNRRKGLGRDDKQRFLRVNLPQNFRTRRAVNVGDKIAVDVFRPVFLERRRYHIRPQIRPADTDVDDVGELFARCALKRPAAHRVRKFFHLRLHAQDFRHNVNAVDRYRPARKIAQRRMQHRAVFGNVDFLARKHILNPVF